MVKYRNDFDWLYTYGLALDYLQPGQNAQDCWTLRNGCQLEIASHNVATLPQMNPLPFGTADKNFPCVRTNRLLKRYICPCSSFSMRPWKLVGE